ncbi:MAG: diguanylate cyclase [Candidatus Obscuribacterales bacterium]|nr:diguanylate cyclase [Candidatus Obscuribacterales bacterium]
MTSAQNPGGSKNPFGDDREIPVGAQAGNEPGQELDAVRRHICHILGFDYGLIDIVRGDEIITVITFASEESEAVDMHPIEQLEDENHEPLTFGNSAVARDVVRSMQPFVGKAFLKRRDRGREDEEREAFPYLVVPILEGFDQSKWMLKGLIRLICFDPEREIDPGDMQTLKIVGQHLSSRLAGLAQVAAAVGAPSELETKHVLLVHGNRVVRRRFSRSLSGGGYRVSETDEVNRAIDVLEDGGVDIMVVDNTLKLDDEPFYKSVKQRPSGRYVPLVLVANEDVTAVKVDGLNAGADDCVDENCIEAELLARVRTLIRVRKTETELAMQLKLLEDYTQRLEQVSERERLSSAQISRSHKELEQLNQKLAEEKYKTEIRRGQDALLHKISNILRKSFNIDENIQEMFDHLSEWFQLDCCFVVLPGEDPQDTIRLESFSNNAYSVTGKDRDLQILEIFQSNFNYQDPVFVSDVKRDKRIEPLRRDVLSHYHMYSLFYIPISYDEKLLGILGGHKCESEHVWSTDNQHFLQQVGDQLAISLTNVRLYKRVERQATTDGLTALFNHRTGQEKLTEQLKLAERYERNVCVVMIDVDHFKSINDTYGHPVGDTVLKKVAQIIKRDCRDVDTPVRYGGEEFLLILPEINREGAVVVAERLRKTLSKEVIGHESIELGVTASLGVACYPDDAVTQHQLLELADKALYMSKRMGRNQVHTAADLQFQDFRDPNAVAPPTEAQPAAPAPARRPPSPDKEEDIGLVPEVVETVKKMAGALYSKSEYNKVHHLETARFAEMVAKVLGLSPKQVEQIRVASLLHDVGLLHVPEDILNKQGQVTAEELKVLMQHPVLGAEMLRSIPALKEICDILENHHECWDGTGYPRGLKGEDIPLAARIVSIVDAYHAMISDRPYRAAMSADKAKRVLKASASTQFDPFLVDIFLAVLAELEIAEGQA